MTRIRIISFVAIAAAAPSALLDGHDFVFPAKNPSGGTR
jgi:hypothetical protein